MNITVTGSSFGIRSCHEHRHQCWELVFMLDGSCTTSVNQQTFQLQKGSVFITPPNAPHSTSSKESYSDMFLQCDAFPINTPSPVLLYDFDGSIGQLFSLIHTLNLKNSTEYQPVLRSLGDALASHLQICLGSASHFPFISEIKAALEANLTAAEFDLPTYLNSLGYNADYIRRCFKQACHVTPLQYLQELRLTYAKKLLTNTNYTIKEIAGLCGYADPYYFSRAFKKHFGTAPHYIQGEKVCDPINRTQPLSNV